MARILSVGADAQLLYTRNLVLQRACRDVCGAGVEPALANLQTKYYDVLVLCHTLSALDVIRISETVEQFWPLSRILLMEDDEDATLPTGNLDAAFPWKQGPVALLALMVELMREAQLQHIKQALLISSHVPSRQPPYAERYVRLDLPRYPPQSSQAAETRRAGEGSRARTVGGHSSQQKQL